MKGKTPLLLALSTTVVFVGPVPNAQAQQQAPQAPNMTFFVTRVQTH
jgi:hypothetical protein